MDPTTPFSRRISKTRRFRRQRLGTRPRPQELTMRSDHYGHSCKWQHKRHRHSTGDAGFEAQANGASVGNGVQAMARDLGPKVSIRLHTDSTARTGLASRPGLPSGIGVVMVTAPRDSGKHPTFTKWQVPRAMQTLERKTWTQRHSGNG